MPELPDLEVYLAALRRRVLDAPIEEFKLLNPFVLRSLGKPDLVGRRITEVSRLGKRVVSALDSGEFVVIHLMIAGRFRWLLPGVKLPPKITHAFWRFASGTLVLTEASSKKRAGIWVVRDLAEHQVGGIDPLTMSFEAFEGVLTSENRTLKRALTNPRWFAGIGNAYSDEILHAARLSPLRLTGSLTDEERARLFDAVPATLMFWRDRLLAIFKDGEKFPGAGEITAFRPDFAAHGKYGQPCPVCGKPIQRIVYAENETNYCAVCQNEGRVLADRALSRLLKDDWPRTLED